MHINPSSYLRALPRYWRHVSREYRRVLANLGVDYGTNVIICGPPRSGTSLIFSEMARNLPNFTSVVPAHHSRSREVSALSYCFKPGNLIGKMPNDVLHITKIQQISIKSNVFLVSIRDPRDILVSRHQWYNKSEYWVYPTSETPINRGMQEKHAKFGLLDYLKAVKNAKQYENETSLICIIRYEDIANGRIQIMDLLKDCGIPISNTRDRSLRIYENDERASHGPMHNENRWIEKGNREKLLKDFSEHPKLFEYLQYFGYETDNSWFQRI